jgi:hypothetical protein
MGNFKSKNKNEEYSNKEYPNKEAIQNFYDKYVNNPQNIEIDPMLDFFQAHYFKMIGFCSANNISEDKLWSLVRSKGNSYNCLCSECHPDLYN